MIWKLVNVEARAAEHGSFKIPLRSQRENLRVGNLVKLVFIDPTRGMPNGERMWVEVVAVEVGRYRGELRNVPVLIEDLREGDLVEFGPEHVADWSSGEVDL